MISLPIEPIAVLSRLYAAGFEGYIVGGAVRDLLLSEVSQQSRIHDFDFTTNATPKELLALFPESFCENDFGTVSIAQEHVWSLIGFTPSSEQTESQNKEPDKIIDLYRATKLHPSLSPDTSAPATRPSTPPPPQPIYEITTYRKGEEYHDSYRQPSALQWGHSISEDLTRRDFTINALALNLDPAELTRALAILKREPTNAQHHFSTDAYTLVDEHGGIADLTQKLIRTVGTADARFEEDALRMLRAVRLMAELSFKLDDSVVSAIQDRAPLLQNISWERIRDEFFKMIMSPNPKTALETLKETGLLQFVIPELVDGVGVEQGGHHTTDVWTHAIDALDNCPSADPIVRLATLLHDIDKPTTFERKAGQPTFYNHEVSGARTAKRIAERLKLSKQDIQRVFILVRYHMFHYQPENTDASVRRFMRKVGLENIDDILDLREADRLGSGARKTSWRLEEFKTRMIEQLHQPFSISDLAINGHDLMTAFQIAPGPQLGQLLQSLFEHVQEHPDSNTKELLLEEAARLISE